MFCTVTTESHPVSEPDASRALRTAPVVAKTPMGPSSMVEPTAPRHAGYC